MSDECHDACKGETGIQGIRGPVGPTGDTGDQGPQGSSVQGPRGEKGSVGSTGIRGIGCRGHTGVGSGGASFLDTTNYPSPAGSQPIFMWDQDDEALFAASEVSAAPNWIQVGAGRAGAVGATGLGGSGETGLQGIQGLTGLYIQGETGIIGLTGETGIIGIQGLTGLYVQGDTGIIGLTGETGILGLQGLTGLSGLGVTGLQGIQGVTGIVQDLSGYVPYTGATDTVDLGAQKIIYNSADWSGGRVSYVPLGADINTYVAAANSGDTLILGSGTYPINDNITLDKEINLVGQGVNETYIDCTSDNALLYMIDIQASGSHLRGLSLACDNTGVTVGVNAVGNYNDLRIDDVYMDIKGPSETVAGNYGIFSNCADTFISNSNINVECSDVVSVGIYGYVNGSTSKDSTFIIKDCLISSDSGGASGSNSIYMYNAGSTYNLSGEVIDSWAKSQPGGTLDTALEAGSDTTDFNTVVINAYNSTFNGADYDVRSGDANVINLHACELVNNTIATPIDGTVNRVGTVVTDNVVTSRLQITEGATDGYILVSDTTGIGTWQAGSGSGTQGVTGLTGDTGDQGVTGLTGDTGDQGVTGLTGDTGDTGDQGVTGLLGINGGTGIQGLTGILGIDGQTGIQGLTGLALGETGIQGLVGETGIQGDTGIKGVTGISPDVTGFLKLDQSTAPQTDDPGTGFSWNTSYYTANIHTGLGPVLQAGQETHVIVSNNSGSEIEDGKVVYLSGLHNGYPSISKAIADTHEAITGPVYLTTMTIPDQSTGIVTDFGRVQGINTSGYSFAGATLYLSDTTAGDLTETRPEFPSYEIPVAGVEVKDSSEGVLFVDINSSARDTFDNFWNGVIRESFDFRTSVTDGTVIGALSPSNGHPDLTLIFSDGFSIFDTSPDATIALTPGSDNVPQTNYVYIPKTTKALTVSPTEFPTDAEHIKIAVLALQSAATTDTNGALRNQNINDHLAGTTDLQGHLSHIGAKLRKFDAQWDSGTAGSLTIVGASTPDDVYVDVAAGVVFQMHPQTFPAQDMSTGSDMHIVNDPVSPYKVVSNLNTITDDSDGDTINNKWFSIVVWGVANKTGETSHLMCNLPNGSYNTEADAVADANGYSNYTIPVQFKGVGFLVARFTIKKATNVWTYNSGVGYQDLRGFIPNTTAGSGAGSGGITEFTQLTDTPSAYTSQALKIVQVNAGETALEFTDRLAGETGIQGVTGLYVQGETGIQGIQGDRGVTGFYGLTGVYGLTGDQGDTGIQGPVGPRGVTGFYGLTGVYGLTGDQGDTGIQGPVGPRGVTGFYGLTGVYGLTGDQGETGIQGPQGDRGVTGFYGLTGVVGLVGDQGDTGIQGIQGDRGLTGFYGLTGVYGLTGDQGDTGIQGIQGDRGLTGFYGLTGVHGVTGLIGSTGVIGIQGDKGVTGFYGLTGLYGETGIQGLTGITSPVNVYTTATATTLTPNCTSYHRYVVNALATDMTVAAPTGTPYDTQLQWFRFLSTADVNLEWDAIYAAGGVDLPTTAATAKNVFTGVSYASDTTKWYCIAQTSEE